MSADEHTSRLRWIALRSREALMHGARSVRDHYTRPRDDLSSVDTTTGRGTYGEPMVLSYPGDVARVTIGAFCSFADGVVILPGGEHNLQWVSTFPLRSSLGLPGAYEDGHPASRGDILIGNDVWFGLGALVRSGVTIGSGAVIAARSVVTRDVKPYAVVAGSPAREMSRRFTEAQIERLLRVAWWDWDVEKIAANVNGLNGDDVDRFLEAHDPSNV